MAHPRENPFYSIVPPEPDGTHLSIAHTFRDVEHARRIFAGEEEGYAYACVGEGNPTVRGYERAVAQLETPQENRCDAIATASGRSAILLTALQIIRNTGKKRIVTTPYLYGGTYSLFTDYLSTLGISTVLVENPADMSAWEDAITHDTGFVFVETVSNPLASITDLHAIASIGSKRHVCIVADNTIPTAALFQPLMHGADVVVYSASKSMNGDSRGLGGIIIGNKGFVQMIRQGWFSVMGPVMDPACASRMHKRLATLKTRATRESTNALTLAELLQYTPGIYRVHYPLLERSPYRDLAESLGMTSGGGLLAFELTGTMEKAIRFIESLEVVIHATHLGHEKTLITLPAATTHAKMPRALRKKCGITDTLVRISAGCEEATEFAYVVKDILQALKYAQ